MTESRQFLSRTGLAALVVAPLCIIGVLTVTILVPTLKNPASKIYSSSIGYPSLKRLVGQPIKVQTVPIALRTLEHGVAAPGESVALQEVNVRPLVSGTVEQVYVVEGKRVTRGQPLLQIQRAPFEDSVNTARINVATAQNNLWTAQKLQQPSLAKLKANVENAKERLAIAKTKFELIHSVAKAGGMSQSQLFDSQDIYVTRQKELVDAQNELATDQISRDKEIEADRLIFENNKIALLKALRDLDHTVLYASTDGLVSQVSIHIGEQANLQNSIITLTQNVVFKAYIDQARLNNIQIGNQATVRLVAYPGSTFWGKVTQLNPTVQTEAKTSNVGTDKQYTYSAWIAVDGLQMPPGLQGYAQFTQSKTSLVIPEDAVIHLSGGEGMVMVAEGGQAVVKRVKLGRLFDNQREVLEGLRAGEQAVLSPRALNPGDRLKNLVLQGQ